MSMRVFFFGIWPLFMGLFFIMAGNSVQGALVAYRLGLLGFSNLTSGIVLAGYSLGMLIAVSTLPYFVKSVGHVRVFAAMAAIVSAALLLFPLWVHPLVWFLLRLSIGFCYVGLYVVAEAWINALATNEIRGRMLSFYMITQLAGFIAGQFTLRFTTPESATLFVVGSVAISLSAVPMLMVKVDVPMKSQYSRRMAVGELYRYSPFALVGTFLVAMQLMPFYTALGFFAQKADMNLQQLSVLSILALLAGALAQWPMARISDRIDRRNVIMTASLIAVGLAVLGLGVNLQNNLLAYGVIALLALCILPIYAINLSHANDVIPPEKIVSAGSTIQMCNASGTMMGPVVFALFIDHLDAPGFFLYIASVSALLVLFTFYRKKVRHITVHRRAFIAPLMSLRSAFKDPNVAAGEHKREKWDISKLERPAHRRTAFIDNWLDRWLKKQYNAHSSQDAPPSEDTPSEAAHSQDRTQNHDGDRKP